MSTAGAFGGKRHKKAAANSGEVGQLGLPGIEVHQGEYDPDAWSTPWPLFKQLDDEFHFTLDVCASDHNHKCDRYFTKQMDGLSKHWSNEVCFMNPPYSEVDAWLCKAVGEVRFGGAIVVALVKADTSTKWWRQWHSVAKEVRFLHRVQFEPPPGYTGKIGSPNMGHALLIFRR